MEKSKAKIQRSILDFFKKSGKSSNENNESNISNVQSYSERSTNIKIPTRKRRRAISQRVKKVLKANKKKKIETICISDENDCPSDEALFELEEDSFTFKSEVVQEILDDWHTPEKVAQNENYECKTFSEINHNERIKNTNLLDLTFNVSNDIHNVEGTSKVASTQKENKFKKFVVSRDLTTKTPPKAIIGSVKKSDSRSSYASSLKSPRIVSPERTPTPSPCSSSNKTNISPYIRNSPGKFNLHKASSPRTPSHLNRSVRNGTLLANSSNYGNSVKRQLSLDSKNILSEGVSNDLFTAEQNISSPSKYRKINGLYLDNFNFIMECVLSSAHDVALFNNDDIKVIDNFRLLSLEAKKMYVRLIQRKLRWLQYAKIFYGDICEKEDTYIYLNELVYSGFLHSERELKESNTILNILGKKELQQLCKDFKVKPIGTRETIINSLIKNSQTQRTIISSFGKNDQNSLLSKCAKDLAGMCCILNKEARNVFMRILTLFSLPSTCEDEGAGQQSQLKILLMQKLGKLEFPSYEVLRHSSIFSNRESVIRFLKCYQLDCSAREFIEQKEWEKVVEVCNEANIILVDLLNDSSIMLYDAALPMFLRRYTSLSVLLYIQNHLIEALQRLKRYKEAVSGLEFLLVQKIHLQDLKGRWYDRLALNYEQHLKNPEKALHIITEALEDPEVMVGHRFSLSQRAQRIMNSKKGREFEDKFKRKISIMEVKEAPKLIIQANSLPADIPGFKRIYISNENNSSTSEETSIISSVEEHVLTHYKKQGYQHGLHGEGRTIRVVFGLLFWDCIYSPVPDAFLSSYQGAPLDLNSRHFYEARKEIIDERLVNIRRMCLQDVYEEVEKIWKANEGKVSVVNWTVFHDIELVKSLIMCLGIELVTAICERLCKNHRFTRSGFPDLIVWNTTSKSSRIVEVKGPNDKLSTKQMLWLEFLMDNGATAEVCHVEALGARRRN